MVVLLALLPVVSGFVFLDWFPYSRFRFQRISGLRLLLESSYAGVILVVVSSIFVFPISLTAAGRTIQAQLPVSLEYGGSMAVAFFLGPVVALILKSGVDVDGAKLYAQIQAGDYLAYLSMDALDGSYPVTVCLRSKRVYMGYVTMSPNLTRNTSLGLLVAAAGYATRSTKWEPYFSEDYYAAWQGTPRTAENFKIVIPFSMITVMYPFTDRFEVGQLVPSLGQQYPSTRPYGARD